MKKTLIALAAIAATSAFAQSSVQIDGVLDAGFQQVSNKGVNTSDIGSNASATSGLNFRGTEDLGGGLKANFRFESNWNPVANNAVTNAGTAQSTFGNGELRLGLSGGFGEVQLGRVNLPTLSVLGMGTPLGTTNYGNGFGAGHNNGVVSVTDSPATADAAGNHVRRNNAVRYFSPSFSGFQVHLYNVSKVDVNSATADHRGVVEGALTYVNGPITIGYAQNTESANTALAGAAQYDSSNQTLAGNYNFGNGLTVYALSQRAKRSDDSLDRLSTLIGARYVTGAHTFAVVVGNSKDSGTATAAQINLGKGKTSNLASLGYDYALSKRTALYGRYENINDDGNVLGGNTANDNKRTRTALGLRHTF